jgi:tRNA pseudouridine38-40 synthase
MRNIKLLLRYDGSAYHGWGRQKDCHTLQQTIEEAIQSLTGEAVRAVASGRTDSGVHALGQVANFRSNTRHECDTIRRALNALLPDDFRVIEVTDADPDFHARYSAKSKMYRYVMYDNSIMDPFLRHYVVRCDRPLNDPAMRDAAQYLLGTHDFSSFETAGAPRDTSVRTISHIAVFRDGPERIWAQAGRSDQRSLIRDQRSELGNPQTAIPNPPLPRSPLIFLEVAADGFLYNMVRAIAGTLIQVGVGYWPVEMVQQILQAKDRTRAGPTALAHGLFLVRVDY